MNIIFLDIDGVLNSRKYINKIHSKVLDFCSKNDMNVLENQVNRQLMDINRKNLSILLKIIRMTNSSVVIISSWKNLSIYCELEKRLIQMGIPIIGYTMDNGIDRGRGIREYINRNNIEKYIIIDDEICYDYESEFMNKLIKTSYYGNGIERKHKKQASRILKR